MVMDRCRPGGIVRNAWNMEHSITRRLMLLLALLAGARLATAPAFGQADEAPALKRADEQVPDEQVPDEQHRLQWIDRPHRLAYWIEAQGVIGGRMEWFIDHQLRRAERLGADLVVIELTTPGGELEASFRIARRLRDVDWATTVVFIPEEAISGGAIVSLGAQCIVMAQGALIGDAGPIQLGMHGFEHVEEKALSYIAAAVRELAEAQGRPPAIAQAMVDRNVQVYRAVDANSGQVVYVSEADLQNPENAQRFEQPQLIPESGQDRFLTIGAERAHQLQLCDLVVKSRGDFESRLRADAWVRARLRWIDATVYLLNRPWLTMLLLVIGLIGIYLEFAAPGISVAGMTAALCFGLFFWSHILGGTSGWLEVLLFLLGVGCLACELFILPGFGAFGVTGIVLIVLSLVMATQDFLVPKNPAEWRQLRTNVVLVAGAVLGVLVLLAIQILWLDSIPGLNRLKLPLPTAGPDAVPAASGSTLASSSSPHHCLPPVGAQGIAYCDLRPSGKAQFGEEVWDVLTEGDFVEEGTPVRVLRHEGNRVIVRAVR